MLSETQAVVARGARQPRRLWRERISPTTRIRALIALRTHTKDRLREEAILPLHHLFAAGPLTRGEFKQMTGLGERNAQALLSKLLAQGLVETDSPLGPVRFGLPLDALQFLLPGLYPEAATHVTDR